MLIGGIMLLFFLSRLVLYLWMGLEPTITTTAAAEACASIARWDPPGLVQKTFRWSTVAIIHSYSAVLRVRLVACCAGYGMWATL